MYFLQNRPLTGNFPPFMVETSGFLHGGGILGRGTVQSVLPRQAWQKEGQNRHGAVWTVMVRVFSFVSSKAGKGMRWGITRILPGFMNAEIGQPTARVIFLSPSRLLLGILEGRGRKRIPKGKELSLDRFP